MTQTESSQAAGNLEQTYEALCSDARQTALLESVLSLLEWDERTQMPVAAGDYRGDQVAWMAGEIHRRQTLPQIGQWLQELGDSPLARGDDSPVAATIIKMQRDYRRRTLLPQKLVEELSRWRVRGQQVWAEARRQSDFGAFLPALQRIVELKREEAAAIGYIDTPYDALLEEYEPGETTARVGDALAKLGVGLRDLVREIADSGRQLDNRVVQRRYPVATQEAFGRKVAAAIGFDFKAGSLSTTDHPFCCTTGPRDVRLTTRYREDDFCDAFYSTLHEAGHGLYEQGLPSEHFGLPLGSAASLGIHESQSRLWENSVGRSRGFWDRFFGEAAEAFPVAFGDANPEVMYQAVNRVEPSLIRVDADEVTYNLHIFIRFALERALLEDRLEVAYLPEAWNQHYHEFLGITPPDDASGVLQDVHWAAGLFGYFPTYALGNLYAAQFADAAQRELGDLEALYREGDFPVLLEWLRRHVHQFGARYTAAELVVRATGSPLSERFWIAQMRKKYGELYGL
ncbi:MAG: carboxypeptidase M32 [Planctomycetales bacterium]|nr:carboxypeptidase M32 [Planctomycetales bacterium]